jgi:hypothetical protein
VNPDVLQEELNDIMNLTRLNEWYSLVGQFDTPASAETRVVSAPKAAQVGCQFVISCHITKGVMPGADRKR